jgi:hypothetical protein
MRGGRAAWHQPGYRFRSSGLRPQSSRCQTAQFLRSRARCCARVLFCLCFGLLRPTRGRAERREAVSSVVALSVKARTTFARRGRPGQAGTGLSALQPWRFWARSALRLRSCLRLRRAGDPCCRVSRPVGQGSRTSRGADTDRGAGRQSSLRLQDRLRTTPLVSEDGRYVSELRNEVNEKY